MVLVFETSLLYEILFKIKQTRISTPEEQSETEISETTSRLKILLKCSELYYISHVKNKLYDPGNNIDHVFKALRFKMMVRATNLVISSFRMSWNYTQYWSQMFKTFFYMGNYLNFGRIKQDCPVHPHLHYLGLTLLLDERSMFRAKISILQAWPDVTAEHARQWRFRDARFILEST